MYAYLWAILITCIVFLALGWSYYGWGRMLTRILGVGNRSSENGTISIWLGWAFTLFLFQILNFILPLSALVVVPVFLMGMLVSVPELSKTVNGAFKLFLQDKQTTVKGLVTGVIFLCIVVWVISRSMLSPDIYDDGLYHFNMIRWINTYPIIPGLGNLHGRLALNQSFFIYVAALNFYPWGGFGRSLANSFLFLLLVATIITSLLSELTNVDLQSKHPYRYIPELFILPILIYLPLITSNELASPSADLALTLLQIVFFLEFAKGIAAWQMGVRDQEYRIVAVTILAATAITVKLSSLAFSAAALGVFLVYVIQISRSVIQGLIRIFIPLALILVSTGIRGYLLSGAPLFPSTIGYIPFEWAMPIKDIKAFADSIVAWARDPNAPSSSVLSGWNWLMPWSVEMSKHLVDVVYPAIIFLAFGCTAALIGVLSCRTKKLKFQFLRWVILLPSALGVLYWFFTAPDPRFASSIFWLLMVGAASILILYLHEVLTRKTFLTALCCVFMITNLGFAKSILSHLGNLRDISLAGWYPVPSDVLIQQTTASGLVVYFPKDGDQCWDSSLPCTPTFNPNLELRVPGSLESGFEVAK